MQSQSSSNSHSCNWFSMFYIHSINQQCWAVSGCPVWTKHLCKKCIIAKTKAIFEDLKGLDKHIHNICKDCSNKENSKALVPSQYRTISYHMTAGLVQQSYTKSYKRLLGTKCLQRPPWWNQRVFTLTGVDEDVCAVITFRDRAQLHSSIRTVPNLWNIVVVVSWLIQSFPMPKRWWVLEKENTSCSFLKEEKSHRTD